MNFTLFFHFTAAGTGRTFFLDDLPFAAAVAAGPPINHTAKRRVLYDFLLTGTVAHGASNRLRSRFSPGAKAGVAVFGARNCDVRFLAEYRFLELDRHRVLQIVAALRSVRITPTAAAAEEHIENIPKAAKIPAGKAAAHPLIRINMAVLVITRTFP
ncbi:hypothetical protein D3C81_785810 [compost metagenome]